MMLPSTGLFKATNCPFYDSGLCERPYCHFRHVKKDPLCSLEADGEVLEQLVSDAVQKVLQHSETPPGSSLEQLPNEVLVSKVVEDLVPIAEGKDSVNAKSLTLPMAIPSYKPTPIAELNKKRHIPVPYTPRNFSSVQPKRRKSSENLFAPSLKRTKLSEKIAVTPSSEYNPDVDTNKCVGYSPSVPSSQANGANSHSYIPSAIANLISPLIDYVPTGNSDTDLSYEPSGQKIQEPEYRPQFDPGVSPTCRNYTPTDKAVLEELNLDEYSSELELLDEIIYAHSESVSKKQLEKLSNESSIEYLDVHKASDMPIDIKESNMKDIVTKPHSAVNQNQTANSPPGFGDVYVPNDSVNKDVAATKVGKGMKEKKERSEKERHRTKSSHHSSSNHKSSRSSKSSSSKDIKHEDKHKHKKNKSSSKADHSKEHKSSSTSKSAKKSKSSSTSKDHKSASRSKEKKSSSSSRNYSKPSSTKVSTEEITGSPPSQPYDVDSEDNHSCSNEPMTDPDDDEIAEECFKIFQEYAPDTTSSKKSEPVLQKVVVKEGTDTDQSSKKHRVAREGTTQSLSKMVAPPPRKPLANPALTMVKRFEELKESYELKMSEKAARTTLLMRRVEQGGLITTLQSSSRSRSTKDLSRGLISANSSQVRASSSAPCTVPSSTKLRIAHVPNVPSLLEEKTRMNRAKQNLHQRTLLKNRLGNNIVQPTIAQTAPKGGQRSAHVPSATLLQRPVILPETGAKIPTSTRQKYLDVLIREHENFMSREESYKRSAEAEKIAYGRSKTKAIYTSSVTGIIMRLRKENGMSGTNSTSGIVNHADMLKGKRGKHWSVIQTKKPEIGSIYDRLERYVLTPVQLEKNGFPRHHPEIRGMAVSQSVYDKNLPWEGRDRICIRCSKSYTVNSKGIQIENDDCPHHWGKLGRGLYKCCSLGIDSPPCSVGTCHVTTNFLMNNTGFVETITSDEEPADGDYGVYALDCEMVYTTKGIELARVTVIDRTMKTVYDTMVKPSNPILDYATRFSGITEASMRDVTTTIAHVQAALMSFINAKTILIGHSLDSDLRALKLIHDTVVDTSVAFPHDRNGDFKNPLRALTYRFLKRLIQESEEGHNSAEDAIASMELMLYRIREDMKTS